jgi:hypothetical protein
MAFKFEVSSDTMDVVIVGGTVQSCENAARVGSLAERQNGLE